MREVLSSRSANRPFMRSVWIPPLAAMAFCTCLVSSGRSQTDEPWPGDRLHPYFGLAVGFGTIPRTYMPGCPEGWEGQTPGSSLEFRLGIARDQLGVEARTLRQAEMVFSSRTDCVLVPSPFQNGVHTVRRSAFEREAFTLTDVRIRYALTARPATWLLSAGAGWIWGSDAKTISLGSALRVGRLVRGALDAELIAYRTPWDAVTSEWRDFEWIREVRRERSYEWRTGFTFRAGLEIPVRR